MESENEYRMIFESSPLGIIYFDENGMITFC
ncbi:PAS domain S-box protein, partial [Methanococcoides sp.]